MEHCICLIVVPRSYVCYFRFALSRTPYFDSRRGERLMGCWPPIVLPRFLCVTSGSPCHAPRLVNIRNRAESLVALVAPLWRRPDGGLRPVRPIPEDSEVDTHSSYIFVCHWMCIPTVFLTWCWFRSFLFLAETRLSTELECCEFFYFKCKYTLCIFFWDRFFHALERPSSFSKEKARPDLLSVWFLFFFLFQV